MTVEHYDIIGDIHGEADKLAHLLEKLGYQCIDGVYQQARHQVVFVGDFIDRGVQQKTVLNLVRAMIDSGQAQAVMGNHEFNAICYHTSDNKGDYLRPHHKNNTQQHQAFLDDYPLGATETNEMIAWFKTLPLFLEIDGFRVIHACWEQSLIEAIKPQLDEKNCLKNQHYAQACEENNLLYEAIEVLLKGKELNLPDNAYFTDKDGTDRHQVRVKWWQNALTTYKEAAVVSASGRDRLPDLVIPEDKRFSGYPSDAPPVFFGHYWFTGELQTVADNAACLDYSAVRSGRLVAYRLNTHHVFPLKNMNFVGSDEA